MALLASTREVRWKSRPVSSHTIQPVTPSSPIPINEPNDPINDRMHHTPEALTCMYGIYAYTTTPHIHTHTPMHMHSPASHHSHACMVSMHTHQQYIYIHRHHCTCIHTHVLCRFIQASHTHTCITHTLGAPFVSSAVKRQLHTGCIFTLVD